MTIFKPELIELLAANLHLVAISFFGGVVLFVLKLSDHLHRPPEDKMSNLRTGIIFFGLFIGLPILGAAMSIIYILNGDKMSALLAFQVGLTSPAIAKSAMTAYANRKSSSPLNVPSGA
ncbi:hypothetical protein [Microbulbifer zhoushanensis]|uniref:hypothetical protein n=1 Tax=Microbulbifer TaxID=48073 RepID=UPI001F29A3AF|nr:hypothetical protein [Microbulbifer zhoushanensis]